MTHRFEVDYKERLEQSRTAKNAVRLPRLGYALYRVYDIEETKESRRIQPGPMNIYQSGQGGTSSYTMNVYKNRQTTKHQSYWQRMIWAIIDELDSEPEPAYEVKWLKPKQAMVLRLKGHRVELEK